MNKKIITYKEAKKIQEALINNINTQLGFYYNKKNELVMFKVE